MVASLLTRHRTGKFTLVADAEPMFLSFRLTDGSLPLRMKDGPASYSTNQLKRNRSLTPVAEAAEGTNEPVAKRHQRSGGFEPQSSQRRHEHPDLVDHFRVEMLTPSLSNHHTHGVSSAGTGNLEDYDDLELDDTFATFDTSLFDASPKTISTDIVDDPLFLGSSDRAIHDILRTASFEHNFQPPPSSVLRAHGSESRSAEEFDPTLQYSSPESSTLSAPSRNESLLDQEVDWRGVQEKVKNIPRNSSLASFPAAQMTSTGIARKAPQTPASSKPELLTTTWVSKGFRDMRLADCKTFFHIKEMLQTKIDMFQNQAEVTFELFARVMYSSRENFHHKQYFQFRDLFKEAPPYLAGVLSA
ncbi:hypothetical protein PT974_03368 [Cladobotryum mycophilum]|uniref:Uncharacterized protein n=1 Tax=Cladobotryum mycophilum TaxID=491253 RepID=A0ABR0SS43_9HYPO